MLEQLSREECLRLMGSVPVGRIVYTRQALPAVELVNFALDDGGIIIRTDAGGKLAAATRGAVVAFEADSVDVAGHAGWSVTVVGHAAAVTDGAEIARLEQSGLMPWAPGNRDHFIRVLPGDRERAADRCRAGSGSRNYRLFALNAQAGMPDRDGVTFDSPFGPGNAGHGRRRYFPCRWPLLVPIAGCRRGWPGRRGGMRSPIRCRTSRIS